VGATSGPPTVLAADRPAQHPKADLLRPTRDQQHAWHVRSPKFPQAVQGWGIEQPAPRLFKAGESSSPPGAIRVPARDKPALVGWIDADLRFSPRLWTNPAALRGFVTPCTPSVAHRLRLPLRGR